MTDHIAPEDLSAYLDGELPKEERRAVEEHLAGCHVCRDELATLSWTVEFVRAAPRAEVPAGASFHIPVGAEEAGGTAARRVPTVLAAFSLVAAAVLVSVALGRAVPGGGRSVLEEATTQSAAEQPVGRPTAPLVARAEQTMRAPSDSGGGEVTPAAQAAAATDEAIADAVIATATQLAKDARRGPDVNATMTAVMQSLQAVVPPAPPLTGGRDATAGPPTAPPSPSATSSPTASPFATAPPPPAAAGAAPADGGLSSHTMNVVLALAAALAAGAVAWVALRERGS